MANIFHLAIPAGDISIALKFYKDMLGCQTGNQERGRWIDINFWGNELTLHQTNTRQNNERHHVDMGDVSIPHFGVHLEKEAFLEIKKRIEASSTFNYLDKPYRRFVGTKLEQETFFVEDPNGNVLEIKTMKNSQALFES